MKETDKQARQRQAGTKLFLEDCFGLYSLTYDRFFADYDEYGERSVRPLYEKGEISQEILGRSAMILGMTAEEILSLNREAAMREYRKYPFFAHLRKFRLLRKRSLYGEHLAEALLRRAIFPAEKVHLPARYDEEDLRRRMIARLEEAEAFLPGTVHRGAEITEFAYETEQFFSYPAIGEMLSALEEVLARAKELYLKAWAEELGEEERREYDFLVSTLEMQDTVVHRAIYYQNLRRLLPVYRAEGYAGDERAFSSLVRIKIIPNRFTPWACREFAEDRARAERLAEFVPNLKSELFMFGEEVRNFSCRFRWSDAVHSSDEDLAEGSDELVAEENSSSQTGVGEFGEWTHVRIPKTEEELKGDGVYAERLIRLGGVASKGGLRVTYKARDRSEFLERMMARVEVWGKMYD